MDQTAKQQVVERLKGANNVLVTVSSDPSVDQLAAAIAMTIMMNSMGKHATAVFSGKIPDTMQFLDPTKTLEETVDSLRDFIISLDKNKADKLRYKVEDDVVKIFITPYRTRISNTDLVFSQGDYNVDAVLALGVHKKDDLDKIIVEHGRILHDAAVISANTGGSPGDVGAINWIDATASSLCEMMMSISEALQSGLVDEQVATALLTGIVSETDRFSNEKTSPKVMTMAAQLMAAGANQQLIASNLHAAVDINVSPAKPHVKPKQDPSEMDIAHAENTPVPKTTVEAAPPEPTTASIIANEPEEKPVSIAVEDAPKPSNNPPYEAPKPLAAQDLGIDLPAPIEAPSIAPTASLPSDLPPGPIADMIHDTKGFTRPHGTELDEPLLGGTFNATSSDAREAAAKAQIQGENNTILNHDTGDAPDSATAAEPVSKPSWAPLTPQTELPQANTSAPDDFARPLDSLTQGQPRASLAIGEKNPAAQVQALDNEKLSTIDEATKQSEAAGEADTLGSLDLDSARQAVEAAMGSADFNPENNPVQAIGTAGETIVAHQAPAPMMPPPMPSADFGVNPPDVPPPFTPELPPTPELNGQHPGGYAAAPPTPEASPQDFTLPNG